MTQFRIRNVATQELTGRTYKSLAGAHSAVCDVIEAQPGGLVARVAKTGDCIVVIGRANGFDVSFVIEPVLA